MSIPPLKILFITLINSTYTFTVNQFKLTLNLTLDDPQTRAVQKIYTVTIYKRVKNNVTKRKIS